VDGERAYSSGVFYCKDAFEGLETMDALQDTERRASLVAKTIADARSDVFLRTGVGKDIASGTDDATRSETPSNNRIPEPPFWGARVCRDIPLDEIFALLDLDELYRLQWGARGSGPKYEATIRDEFEPARLRLQADAAANGWLQPRAVYGYFPVQSAGNDLIVYDPAAYGSDGGSLREIARFKYPRMVGRERLCLADYFRSVESGDVDVAAFQVVTVGDEASRRFEDLQGRGEYSEAYYVHGLAVEAAEAVAMWMHQRVRRELGISDEQGKRYSWGYGACPDLDDHETVFRILPVAETIGVTLTTAFQLMPEQSTAAMIVHHPDAKYYAVRGVAEAGSAAVAEPSVASAS
jgi:5-methyltetrahydrofolate--homocysteine methyltransferase